MDKLLILGLECFQKGLFLKYFLVISVKKIWTGWGLFKWKQATWLYFAWL